MSKLQLIGTISLGDIQAHFGGSNPAALSEYYRGGGRVPNNSINIGNGIPTSGFISLSSFYGASNEPVLSASVSPSSVSGTGSESTEDRGTTNAATCTASGGGANTFYWEQISGDPELAADSTTSSQTTFSVFPQRGHYLGVFRCTVTSADGQTASDTVEVDINILL